MNRRRDLFLFEKLARERESTITAGADVVSASYRILVDESSTLFEFMIGLVSLRQPPTLRKRAGCAVDSRPQRLSFSLSKSAFQDWFNLLERPKLSCICTMKKTCSVFVYARDSNEIEGDRLREKLLCLTKPLSSSSTRSLCISFHSLRFQVFTRL